AVRRVTARFDRLLKSAKVEISVRAVWQPCCSALSNSEKDSESEDRLDWPLSGSDQRNQRQSETDRRDPAPTSSDLQLTRTLSLDRSLGDGASTQSRRSSAD